MKKNPLLAAVLTGAGALACGSAQADATTWDPSWAFSGFGTLGYVKTDTDVGLFNGQGQPGGASKDGNLGVDSKLGLQVNAKANNVFSATVQGLSQRNGKGSFKPGVEWAFAKAQVTPGLSLRAGRIGVPLFVVSDYRNIGYSNLMVRSPVDVYGQVGFSHFDGGDAIYQDTVGAATITGQVFYGKSDSFYTTIPVHIKKMAGVNLVAEFDNGITLRIGRVQGDVTIGNSQVAGLVALLRTTPYASVGDEVSADNKRATFSGVGVAYDHENWVGSLEYTKRKNADFVATTTGWAAILGYRIGKFTPYGGLSQLKVVSTNVNNTIPRSVPQLAPLAFAVDAVVASQDIAQKSDSIGLRWDAWKNLDVKAQYERIQPAHGAVGLFQRVSGPLPSSVNVFSVAVDFVF